MHLINTAEMYEEYDKYANFISVRAENGKVDKEKLYLLHTFWINFNGSFVLSIYLFYCQSRNTCSLTETVARLEEL